MENENVIESKRKISDEILSAKDLINNLASLAGEDRIMAFCLNQISTQLFDIAIKNYEMLAIEARGMADSLEKIMLNQSSKDK